MFTTIDPEGRIVVPKALRSALGAADVRRVLDAVRR
jgi:bifunctional DNA-binding transcriptional regulator/antitoxin component of YhaV-PrlF toxin-antitoxin module